MIEIIKAILFGVVEGITEWLPISSTGHMILLDSVMPLNVEQAFWDMFLVVIQLGAIFAVVLLFWGMIWPFGLNHGAEKKKFELGKVYVKENIILMWVKVVIACLPAIVFKIFDLDTICDQYFYNPVSVALALILFGVAFILIENRQKTATVTSVDAITYKMAVLIGVFQLIAAAFPGTSRSGATIIGALLIGISRTVASEFTFILAIPVMFGASLLELLDFGWSFSTQEVTILLAGMITAFLVSLAAIRFLLGYVKKHNFKVFGWYRIVLGFIVLVYFLL
ncbi:MAG: undecaprenyl-diphosphate phosphatase [Lachnospiraceae bacterium]|nr:undecaprenyl-diphosphate phosphatase [Lachnospiraceae bacterium]